MSPEVTAAIIAGSVSVFTLIVTLAAQYFGRRATSGDTRDALNQQLTEQGKQLDRSFEEQRKQLDKTLEAQSDQLDRTLAEQRTRTLNERFATAAEQLGSDKPAVRLAGVYAMAGLADDWEENRQTCVDVLCAYLRMPYEPDPGQDAPEPQRLAFQAIREVRHTVIRVITAHLKEKAAVSWQGLNFDFTGVVFDGGDFTDARFSGGEVYFYGAEFSGGRVSFSGAEFSGGGVTFYTAKFFGEVDFRGAKFSGGEVSFWAAKFSGSGVTFHGARFSGGLVVFNFAEFSGGKVDVNTTFFTGGRVGFGAEFSGEVDFHDALFIGGEVSFTGARFSSGTVDLTNATFSGAEVSFGAEFSGGTVDFSDADDWSVPPVFAWTDKPPPGVKLPSKDDQSQV